MLKFLFVQICKQQLVPFLFVYKQFTHFLLYLSPFSCGLWHAARASSAGWGRRQEQLLPAVAGSESKLLWHTLRGVLICIRQQELLWPEQIIASFWWGYKALLLFFLHAHKSTCFKTIQRCCNFSRSFIWNQIWPDKILWNSPFKGDLKILKPVANC